MQELQAGGVDGIRLNLVMRESLPDASQRNWQALFGRLRELGMFVEIALEGRLLANFMPLVQRERPTIVIDHFGYPDAKLGVQDPGFQHILRSLADGKTWVKLSAPYRLKGADPQQYVDALLRAGAQERLVWATDWPFVKFERAVTYAQCVGWIHQWIPEESVRTQVLARNPHAIHTFRQ